MQFNQFFNQATRAAKFAGGAFILLNSARAFTQSQNVTGVVQVHENEPNQPIEITQSDVIGHTSSGGLGRNDPLKLRHGKNGAYAKNIPEKSVQREVFIGAIVHHLMTEEYGPKVAPKTYAGVKFNTKKAMFANTINDFLKSTGVANPKARYGSLFAVSTCVGDTDSLLEAIFDLKPSEISSGLSSVQGFGVAMALANLFSGDTNARNFIIAHRDSKIFVYPIDFEVDNPAMPSVLYHRSNGSKESNIATAQEALRLGWIGECEKTLASTIMQVIKEQDDAEFTNGAFSQSTDDITNRDIQFNPEQVDALAQIAAKDFQPGGPVDRMYEKFARLTPEKLDDLADNAGIPIKHRHTLIAGVMAKVAYVRQVTGIHPAETVRASIDC